ncbi:MAG: succinylglutamate desuccinylase/aspartoacylase family protein [Thermoplasmatota archaeon]
MSSRVICGRRVQPGTIAQIHLKVSETVTHRPASIPVTVVHGAQPGPTLFLTGAVHGDEISGVAIVRKVLDTIDPETLKGTLIGVPVVNRFGFHNSSRYLPDRRDLNRFFPGDPTGSMASRIAHRLFEKVIKIADAGIDLHTAAAGQANLCHVRGDTDNEAVKELMKAFGTPVMLEGGGPKGSLRRAATDAGVPTIIFEAGEPNRFQHHVVELGTAGVLRVMRHMGMVDKRPPRAGLNILVKKSEWIRADHGGILDLEVEPGDLVRAKQRIATIHDPFGQHVDELVAPHSGVVLSTATDPLTNPGNAVAHIGHLQKTLQKARDYVKSGGDMGHIHYVKAVKKRRKKARQAAKKATGGDDL